ncbi:MAG: alpha/beta fold hydrolase, partial [Anaerolineae bacterium]|nr:alpha/beta fold hydrolase [Anaerolineae bacterium]
MKRLVILLAVLAVVGLAAFLVWAYTPLGPAPEALAALQSDAQVRVGQSHWMVFWPAEGAQDTGLILYPGGRVDPRAYAPMARAIAAAGYPTVIVPMPLNLAVFGVERADWVRAAYPQVERWAIGGHSLGGAMAAAYAYRNPDAVQGLVLWASYPAANNSLADRDDLAVVSIYGSLDGLATPETVEASRSLLPADAQLVAIEGGNHAQFGWYGPQPGDNAATISHEAQQARVVEATVQLLA